MDESAKRILDFGKVQMLMGRMPRHVLDVNVHDIPVDEEALVAARGRLAQAFDTGCTVADDLERTVHELTCIEDGGLSGAFRRFITTAILAVQVAARSRQLAEEAFTTYLLAIHRAVAERWRDGSYDLSNCLSAILHGRLAERDPADILGGWIWLNLAVAADDEYYFRWVLSTRRFETGTGDEIMCRVSKDAADAFRPTPTIDSISRDQAKRIAERHLSQNPYPGTTGTVSGVVSFDEIKGRKPFVYGTDEAYWERHWIAYLEQPFVGLISQLIMAIDRRTGQVGYTGSAGDEG